MADKKEVDRRTDKQVDLSLYNEVVQAASLGTIQLLESEFRVKPKFFSDQKKSLGYDVGEVQVRYEPEDGNVVVAFIGFEMNAMLDDEEVLFCAATYSVLYELDRVCDSEAVKAFVRRVAPFAAYPYFRSHCATMDWAAQTRLPPLPIHKEPSREGNRQEDPSEMEEATDGGVDE